MFVVGGSKKWYLDMVMTVFNLYCAFTFYACQHISISLCTYIMSAQTMIITIIDIIIICIYIYIPMSISMYILNFVSHNICLVNYT